MSDSIADAYVDLHVNGDALDGEVKASVKDAGRSADKESESSGSRLGSKMAAGFLRGFSKTMKSGAGKVASGFKAIGENAKKAFEGLRLGKLGMVGIAAIIPFVTSGLSALSGAATALVGSIGAAAPAGLALAGVIGGLATAGIAAKIAFGGLGEALKGTEGAMEKLHPNAQALVKTLQGLGPAWDKVKKSIQGNVFAGLSGVVQKLADAYLPVLQKRFGETGTILNSFFKRTAGFLTSEKYVKNFSTALDGNNRIFKILSKAAVPLLRGITNAYIAIQPFAERVAGAILRGARAFSQWAVAGRNSGGIADMMERAFTNATALWRIFKNLGATIGNVFGATAKSGDGLLQTLAGLTERLATFTGLASSQNAIARWAETGIQVTGRLFSFLGKIGSAIAPLFNPNIANGYLSVFEKVLPVIMSVVKVVQGALQPILAGLGDAFAENGPKFAALFEAIAPLLKGVGSVVGELIKQVFGTLGTVAAVLTPVIAAISNFLGPILSRFAPVIATVIFAFTNWTSVILKFVPIIGRLLAPLAKLAEWLWGRLGPALGFVGKIFGKVFGAMMKVGGFVLKALSMWVKVHFTIIKVVVGAVMKGIWAVIKFVWKGISTVFRVGVKIISTVVRTYFNIMRTIITTVLRVIWNVVKAVWKGITTVIGGAVRGIVALVRGAWNLVKSVTSAAWNGIRNLTSSLWAKLVSTFSAGVDNVLGFIRSLPGRIANLAASFINAGKDLGGSVISGIADGLCSAGGFVSDLAGSVKDAINGALNLPFTIKGPGPLPDFTIPAFAKGTIAAPGGIARVGERGPENVFLPRGSKVDTAARTRAGDRNPDRPGVRRKVILRIGSRDFEAYVEEIADGRIDAADSLAFQGA